MTHDELRDKIDEYDCAGMYKEPPVSALRAVVEATLLENPAPISPAFGDGWNMAMKYVIQAIEKELQ